MNSRHRLSTFVLVIAVFLITFYCNAFADNMDSQKKTTYTVQFITTPHSEKIYFYEKADDSSEPHFSHWAENSSMQFRYLGTVGNFYRVLYYDSYGIPDIHFGVYYIKKPGAKLAKKKITTAFWEHGTYNVDSKNNAKLRKGLFYAKPRDNVFEAEIRIVLDNGETKTFSLNDKRNGIIIFAENIKSFHIENADMTKDLRIAPKSVLLEFAKSIPDSLKLAKGIEFADT